MSNEKCLLFTDLPKKKKKNLQVAAFRAASVDTLIIWFQDMCKPFYCLEVRGRGRPQNSTASRRASVFLKDTSAGVDT